MVSMLSRRPAMLGKSYRSTALRRFSAMGVHLSLILGLNWGKRLAVLTANNNYVYELSMCYLHKISRTACGHCVGTL